MTHAAPVFFRGGINGNCTAYDTMEGRREDHKEFDSCQGYSLFLPGLHGVEPGRSRALRGHKMPIISVKVWNLSERRIMTHENAPGEDF